MKKKLTHNLFLKILSVIFAFVLWLMVVIATDPYKTVVISDVPITVINEDEITGQGIGQIYSVVSPQDRTVSVRVYGQKSKVDRLKAEDIKAVVDFGVVSSVGAAYIDVTEPEGVTIMSKNPEMMKIDVEALTEKTFDVALEVVGNAAEGYIINDARISPNVTKITAPESVMQKIAKVGLRVDVSGLSSDINSFRKIVLYDAAGKVIDYEKNDNITLSVSEVQTYVETYMVKEVPLEIYPGGEMQEDLVLMNFSYEPSKVVLKGRKNDLATIDSIVIPKDSGFIDLGNIKATCDLTRDVSLYIPSGVYFMNEDGDSVKLHFEVEKIVEKTFEASMDDIEFTNRPDNVEVEFAEDIKTVSITVEGYEADVKNLTLQDIAPYVNLLNAPEGNSFYRIRVRTSSIFTLVGEPIVNLTVTPIVEEVIENPGEDPSIESTTPAGTIE